MSLFNEASLYISPNGVKAGKLYAVKPTDGSGDLTVTRATTATRVNSAGLIESVAVNVPRLDYTNGSCPSMLVEPQRTNNFLYSEQFDNAYWLKSVATITANNTISPDGNATADKVEFNNGFINGTAIVADNQTYTISFFAKKGTANVIQISEAFYFGTGVVFDLNTGTITSGTGKIENYGNGWYRCSMQITYGVGQAISSWVLRNYQTGYVYLWGIQLEAGSYSTSYIRTTSASVTRNADVISKTGISSLIGQTQGVLFLDYILTSDVGFPVDFELNSDNIGNNNVTIYHNGNLAGVTIRSGGSVIFSALSSAITLNSRNKIALAYKQNDFVAYINGIQFASQTSGAAPLILDNLRVTDGNRNYKINSASVWKTRLTNSQLAELTTI